MAYAGYSRGGAGYGDGDSSSDDDGDEARTHTQRRAIISPHQLFIVNAAQW